MSYKLVCKDVIEALAPLPENVFHGCFCDPPYGLKFMGKKWDHGVPGKEYWAAVLRVLKPGAVVLAFGGTRTYHRLACAIEDAGFELFDSILVSVWMYGQGFPKSLDIGKAIDKAAGAERETTGTRIYGDGHIQRSSLDKLEPPIGTFKKVQDHLRATSDPATDHAHTWDGYGTALKPAWEPVVCARKPLSGTYAENCIEHGVGGLNIDGSRINTRERAQTQSAYVGSTVSVAGRPSAGKVYPESLGRYPANLILSHHPECAPELCHSDCPVGALDRQSLEQGMHGAGHKRSGSADPVPYGYSGFVGTKHFGKMRKDSSEMHRFGDSGGASRFFYQAKVSPAERNAGLSSDTPNRHATLKPRALCIYLARLILPPLAASPPSSPPRLLVPFCGTGSEMAGSLLAGWPHVVGIDNDPESIATAELRIPGLLAR